MFWLINLYIAHCNFVDLNWCLHYLESILIFPAWFPDSGSLAQSKENRINADEHKIFCFHHRNTLRYKAVWRRLCSRQKNLPPPSQAAAPHSPGQLPQYPPRTGLGHQLLPEQMQVPSTASIPSHRIYKIQFKTQQPSDIALRGGSAPGRRPALEDPQGWDRFLCNLSR